jgi:hypothetical protein
MTQGVVASIFARETRLRHMVDALQPEGRLLPALASRGALLRTLVEQRLLKRLIDQVRRDHHQASAASGCARAFARQPSVSLVLRTRRVAAAWYAPITRG